MLTESQSLLVGGVSFLLIVTGLIIIRLCHLVRREDRRRMLKQIQAPLLPISGGAHALNIVAGFMAHKANHRDDATPFQAVLKVVDRDEKEYRIKVSFTLVESALGMPAYWLDTSGYLERLRKSGSLGDTLYRFTGTVPGTELRIEGLLAPYSKLSKGAVLIIDDGGFVL